jgi:hypothetical protein
MRTSSLEQLTSKGIVVIQEKGKEWLVQFVRKDGSGFLTDRPIEWETKLYTVILDLLEKVTLVE